MSDLIRNDDCPGSIVTDTDGNSYCYVLPHPLSAEVDFPDDHPGDFIPFEACIQWGDGHYSWFGNGQACDPVTGEATDSYHYATTTVAEPVEPVWMDELPETGAETTVAIVGAWCIGIGLALTAIKRGWLSR